MFIDEINRINNPGLFLKGLFDMDTGYKFIVSGSGSLELKADIIEPLTGRKKIFYCYPLSFTEFSAANLNTEFKDFESLFTEVTRHLASQPFARQRLIDEYLAFGGYPRVILAKTENEKAEVLREIFQSYLEKDIVLLLKVEKQQAFENLVKILASQPGSLINRAELASTLAVSEKTVNKYLFFLEKTYVISLTRPFFKNARSELTKNPKAYFSDLGFLKIAQGIKPSIGKPRDGKAFENACYLRLKELDLFELPKYWRTKSGAEIDFVILSEKTGKPIGVEVKLSAKAGLGKNIYSFASKYQPELIFIYSYQDKRTKRKIKKENINTLVIYLPFYLLPNKAIELA